MFYLRHVSYIGYEECPCRICQKIITDLTKNNPNWKGAEIVLRVKKVTKENDGWIYE